MVTRFLGIDLSEVQTTPRSSLLIPNENPNIEDSWLTLVSMPLPMSSSPQGQKPPSMIYWVSP